MIGNTTGSLNIGMGYNSLALNESGSFNVAIETSSSSSLIGFSYKGKAGAGEYLDGCRIVCFDVGYDSR